MIRPKAVICDLDGTLCDISHRLHYILHKPKNWTAFEESCSLDKVNPHVFAIIKGLHFQGYKILYVSGRHESVRTKTEAWLYRNQCHFHSGLWMRKNNDSRQDFLVKEEIYKEIINTYDVQFAIDDRKQIVDMWKRIGVYVLDCRQTDKEY